ncbi:hypothetical protein C1645_832195 [Glomus cerebriforme]|uniref:Uncharacterized protein n=1 Tax=Glomus cerebriforme TaxID=658196 RepID=A0A397SG19_9GLOM|nr:hypothetical protein C1645_832195 [Glomus cerebriforme]
MSSVHSNKTINSTTKRVTRSQSALTNIESPSKNSNNTNIENEKEIVNQTYGNIEKPSLMTNNSLHLTETTSEPQPVITNTVPIIDKDIVMGNTEVFEISSSSSQKLLTPIATPHNGPKRCNGPKSTTSQQSRSNALSQDKTLIKRLLKENAELKQLLHQSIQKIDSLQQLKNDITEIKKDILDNKEKIGQPTTNTFSHNTNQFNPQIDSFSDIDSLKTMTSLNEPTTQCPRKHTPENIQLNVSKHLITDNESENMESINYKESSNPAESFNNPSYSNNQAQTSTSSWYLNPLKQWTQ